MCLYLLEAYIKAACDYASEKDIAIYDYETNLEIISYFLNKYQKIRLREHRELTKEQIRSVVLNLPYTTQNEITPNIKGEDYRKMIDRYFETEYQTGCNYQIFHFMSGNIRAKKMQEIGKGSCVKMPDYIREMPFYKNRV